MAEKYYAVRVGKIPGIYNTWAECKAVVHGYPGAKYKGFKTISEAEDFMKVTAGTVTGTDDGADGTCDGAENDRTYAFVDGSYNAVTGVYGYGGFLVHKGSRHIVQGSGNDAEMAAMRNVAGEVLGSMAAVRMAVDMGIEELDIYYDYMGIEMWAVGAWKRNKTGTISYYDYMQSVKGKIKLNFIKVKGHSGVDGNEEADRLAKAAVGIN